MMGIQNLKSATYQCWIQGQLEPYEWTTVAASAIAELQGRVVTLEHKHQGLEVFRRRSVDCCRDKEDLRGRKCARGNESLKGSNANHRAIITAAAWRSTTAGWALWYPRQTRMLSPCGGNL